MKHDVSGYPEPIRAVLEAQFTLARCVASTQMQEWAQLELTIGQLKVLMLLTGHPGMTMSQLAESLSVGKPSTSILVDRLVQLGLVQRAEDESDRRRTLVTVTVNGNDLTTRLHQGNIERLAQWYSALAPEDLQALRRGLEALAAVASPGNSVESLVEATTR